jgi:hypothetical protein
MKLLLCLKCHDIVALTFMRRWCRCGAASRHYLPDGLYAVVSTAAEVIGIDGRTLERAIHNREDGDSGHRTLAAWLMGKDAPRVTWEKDDGSTHERAAQSA